MTQGNQNQKPGALSSPPPLPAQPSNLPADKRREIYDLLMQNKPQLELALPKHLTADRLIRVFVTAMSSNPKLLQCSKTSLLACVLESSQLGLEFDGVLGHAYLVPFRNNKTGCIEATFIPGYKGLIELARRSTEIMNLTPGVVYKGDEFDFEYGKNQNLKHRPGINCTYKDEEITHIYTYAHLKNGGFEFKVMTKGEVERIRKMSKAPNSDAWTIHFPWMAKKTCIKQLCKTLPTSIEYRRAHLLDDLAETGKQRLDFSNFNADLGRVELPIEAPLPEISEPVSKTEAESNTGAEAGAPEPGPGPEETLDLTSQEAPDGAGELGPDKSRPLYMEFRDLFDTTMKHDKRHGAAVKKIVDDYCNKVSSDSRDLTESQCKELLPVIRRALA